MSWYGRLCNSAHCLIQLRLQHLAERGIKDSLRKRGDVIWDAPANKEHGKVVREVVAVVKEEVVRLYWLSQRGPISAV